jgi:hypothetical protein
VARALLETSDLPEGFTQSSSVAPTPFRVCAHRFRGDPPRSERIGTRAFEDPTLGRIEQAVFEFPNDKRASRVVDEVRAIAGRCQRFRTGSTDISPSYVVRVDERLIAKHSVTVEVKGENGVPEATTIVLASKHGVLVRIVDFGAGNAVELRLTQSLALRSLKALGP